MPCSEYNRDANRWSRYISSPPKCTGFLAELFQALFGDVQPRLQALSGPLVSICGSGSNGRTFKLPAMASKGFVFDRLNTRQAKKKSIFPYRFNINYSVCLLINTNININYFQEGLSISILYQLLKKLPYQFQYQYILSISPYDIVKITNFLSISHCYQYQC